MNSVVRMHNILYVVGPPGAGKTTIGREVASQTNVAFHTLDKWAGVVYPPFSRSLPMSDAQVDHAICLLFSEVGRSPAICEFAYHDYISFISDSRYPNFVASRKVIVFADLATCCARNAARHSRVAPEYVERAWHSTKDLIELCAAKTSGDSLVIDTTVTPVPIAIEMAASFFVEE